MRQPALLVPIVDYLMAFPVIQEKTRELSHLRRWYDALSSRARFKATNPPLPPGDQDTRSTRRDLIEYTLDSRQRRRGAIIILARSRSI